MLLNETKHRRAEANAPGSGAGTRDANLRESCPTAPAPVPGNRGDATAPRDGGGVAESRARASAQFHAWGHIAPTTEVAWLKADEDLSVLSGEQLERAKANVIARYAAVPAIGDDAEWRREQYIAHLARSDPKTSHFLRSLIHADLFGWEGTVAGD